MTPFDLNANPTQPRKRAAEHTAGFQSTFRISLLMMSGRFHVTLEVLLQLKHDSGTSKILLHYRTIVISLALDCSRCRLYLLNRGQGDVAVCLDGWPQFA